MFIDSAARPAASTSVAICGAVVRSRKRTCRKAVSFRLVVAGGAVSPGRDLVDRRLCGPAALVLAVEGVEAGADDDNGADIDEDVGTFAEEQEADGKRPEQARIAEGGDEGNLAGAH